MKPKIYLSFFVLFFSFTQLNAQVFWTETFNTPACLAGCTANGYTGLNGAWSISTNLLATNGVFPNEWYVSCAENGFGPGVCGSGCAGDNSLHIGGSVGLTGDLGASYLASNLSETHDRVESPTINCTLYSSIIVSFNYILNGEGTDDNATLMLFDGTTWNPVTLPKTLLTCTPQGLWTHFSYSLPAIYNNNANVQVGFLWDNDADALGTDPSFAVDSIKLSSPTIAANTKPTAFNDASTLQNITLVDTIKPLGNDSDPDVGQTISITGIAVQPLHGSATFSNDTLFYTPNGLYTCGVDSFSYIIGDNGVPQLFDTAWVVIQIGIHPPAPTLLTASPSAVRCAGDTVQLCATPASGLYAVVWSGPFMPNQTSFCFTRNNILVKDSGLYCIYQYLTPGCNSPLACIHIAVDSTVKPTAGGASPVCIGTPLNLTANANGQAGGTWNWTGPTAVTSASQNPTPMVAVAAAADSGWYHVVHTVNSCPSYADSILITVHTCLTPVAGFTFLPNDTICSGTCITLTDTSTHNPTSWNWNFNSFGAAGITVVPAVSGLQNPGSVCFTSTNSIPTMVIIGLSAGNGFGTSSIRNDTIIILPPPPVAGFTASAGSVCAGGTLDFTSSVLTTHSPTSWAWSFGSGANIGTPATSTVQDPTSIQFNTVGATTISMVATNGCGSSAAFTLNVNVNTVPTANFNVNSPYCNNQLINFADNSIGGATSWSWYFGDTASGASDSSHLQNPSHTYIAAGTYTIILIASNACGASVPFTQTVVVNNCSPPSAGFTMTDDTFCMNIPITLTDTSRNGPNILYWTMPGATPGTSNLPAPSIMYTSPGSYTINLTAQNVYGSSSASKTITILSCLPPAADFIINPSPVCAGFCVDLTNISTEAPYTSAWTFTGSDSASSTQQNPTHICFQNPGVFPITLTATNYIGSNTMSKNITVLPSPRIITPNTTILGGNSLTLNATGQGIITWSPNIALNMDTGKQVITSTLNDIVYTVSDQSGCPSPDSVIITVHYQNAIVTIPNAFTPDNDGFNDIFRVTANIPLNEFSMRIYNRWGEMVYHTEDYLSGWDGVFLGVPQNSGVFIYMINYLDLGDAQHKIVQGNLTLIR